jgi:serine/threonine-protein kinase
MGTVYYGRANSSGGLSRVVAIKRMHGDLARDPVCLEMFRDELRLATRVRHPNVVATLDVAQQDGDLLMVMEFVQGESLQELIARCQQRSEPMPPALAVSITCGILQGLEAVHDAKGDDGEPLGIVHRDVSPENILVGRDGIARLLDFGIARGAGRKHVTRVGEIKGKPSYLAPEQITDGGKLVDRRADVYGVSVVLWEALTGRRLFDGENPTVALSKVLTEAVPRPSSIVTQLPQALDEVVMRGLSRDPSERFATALEMARALRSVCGTLLPFEVAEWLARMTPESLARQAARVTELERNALSNVLDGLPPARAVFADVHEAGPESTRTSMSLTPRRTPRSALPLPLRAQTRVAQVQRFATERLARLRRFRAARRLSAPLERARAWFSRPNRGRASTTALVAVLGFCVGILLVRSAVSSTAPAAGVALLAAPASAGPLWVPPPAPSVATVVTPAAPATTAAAPAPSASVESKKKRKRATVGPVMVPVKRPAKFDDGF